MCIVYVCLCMYECVGVCMCAFRYVCVYIYEFVCVYVCVHVLYVGTSCV